MSKTTDKITVKLEKNAQVADSMTFARVVYSTFERALDFKLKTGYNVNATTTSVVILQPVNDMGVARRRTTPRDLCPQNITKAKSKI